MRRGVRKPSFIGIWVAILRRAFRTTTEAVSQGRVEVRGLVVDTEEINGAAKRRRSTTTEMERLRAARSSQERVQS